tara:strand:+ start:49 stop:597 length:549 start_codon:yes stop_codon:yes gene_type:complete
MEGRDIHEAVEYMFKETKPVQLSLAEEYGDKLCYITGPDLEGLDETRGKRECGMIVEENIDNLYEKMDYILNPDCEEYNITALQNMYITTKNYTGLMLLLKKQYPWNLVDDYSLYTHCRNMVGRPITKSELSKIKYDMGALKKFYKKEDKKMKKKKGKYTIEFDDEKEKEKRKIKADELKIF